MDTSADGHSENTYLLELEMGTRVPAGNAYGTREPCFKIPNQLNAASIKRIPGYPSGIGKWVSR